MPEGTDIMYFGRAWSPDADPDGVKIHRITVKATFRRATPKIEVRNAD
jgi:hypothetical protein